MTGTINNGKPFPPMEIRELLNPGSCYSPEAIRAFLRYSRRQSDDSLPTHLPRTGSCAEHISTVLFPAWLARDTLLDYCGRVSDQGRKAVRNSGLSNSNSNGDLDSRSATAVLPPGLSESLRVPPDPRIDAYRARDFGKSPESAEDAIREWVDQELSIESIVRENSCHLLADKCGSFSTKPGSYIKAYNESVYEPSRED
ncbi:hypothetical protein AWJ20_593 [Sugiyamaella lignohabitans]|uniref:Uncharacterized protein n=1 Tax=Sugiyamaella lignohabitans TaxID=796027 RepID=A0A167D0X8_9ASCO|nr:uncharacterized protein AWJ20_593 [Sugiyamaella lignohabitans]ANB12343.1 hypothetical protein AWJ20_593 [Sugiyamaella lignohabitans]